MVRSSITLAALLCAAATVAAQNPAPERPAGNAPAVQQPATPQPPAQQPTPAAPAVEKAASNKVTYSGCLKPGATPGSWILESAELTPAKPGSSVGTSGGMKTTLSLSAKPGTDLKPHADHKVELVGTVAPARPAAAPGPDAPAAQTAPRQELTVESLKMVSTTCP